MYKLVYLLLRLTNLICIFLRYHEHSNAFKLCIYKTVQKLVLDNIGFIIIIIRTVFFLSCWIVVRMCDLLTSGQSNFKYIH